MDYLKYKTIKFHNEYKNRKKLMNETLHNGYTECSEKTAPTNASEALRSRSGKYLTNNYFDYKKSNFNTISICDSNKLKEFGNQEINTNINNFNNINKENFNRNYDSNNNSGINKNNYANNINNANLNTYKNNKNRNDLICENNFSNSNHLNRTRKKIDEFLEESILNKNIRTNGNSKF